MGNSVPRYPVGASLRRVLRRKRAAQPNLRKLAQKTRMRNFPASRRTGTSAPAGPSPAHREAVREHIWWSRRGPRKSIHGEPEHDVVHQAPGNQSSRGGGLTQVQGQGHETGVGPSPELWCFFHPRRNDTSAEVNPLGPARPLSVHCHACSLRGAAPDHTAGSTAILWHRQRRLP